MDRYPEEKLPGATALYLLKGETVGHCRPSAGQEAETFPGDLARYGNFYRLTLQDSRFLTPHTDRRAEWGAFR